MRLKISIALILCLVITGFSQTPKKIKVMEPVLIQCETGAEENFETDFIPADKKKNSPEIVQKVIILGCVTFGEKDEKSTGASFHFTRKDEDKVIYYVQVKALENCEVKYAFVWREGDGISYYWTSDSYKLKKCKTYWFSVSRKIEDIENGVCNVSIAINTKKPSSGSGARDNFCNLITDK